MTILALVFWKIYFFTLCVCVFIPVLAVLDTLAKCGSLSQRRVPTAAGTGGQDAILKGERKKIRVLELFKMEDRASVGDQCCGQRMEKWPLKVTNYYWNSREQAF